VHFAERVPEAVPEPESEEAEAGKGKVISGMRKDASVLIWVDVVRSGEKMRWWRSANGVVLTEGDEEGVVPLEFVKRVVRRGTGEVIWRPEERPG